ncbi:NACHT and WD repeat domain-containing protein [Flavilitoribacter nigricans]|uniref:Novel STAND NTPase 1 domain-containing protein n=1 Tax=Flavilitoribacter nigricans (strain ATCC 23147 / DSM 23189 / NBRC 102662 / NCIMB 1420 / SS-2) TaxID=1122177 RepID=A0A2D0MXI0_FLAN2|nr:AAA family ATPase [Flavilitoribacter nigricans]PHN00846.1 hypothetical protein CRP01_40130 [Flavilitoribacter nigricans DSM 23189 = NBRC 102662]
MIPLSPFKLLDPYTREDQAIFFGRSAEVDRLYELVNESRLILVYGASGVGKTSLVQCGLANRFNDTDWFEVYVRRRNNINRSLRRVIKRHALMPVPSGSTLETAVDSLFLDYLKPIYFVFDQFEEVYILGTNSERKRFYKYIARLLDQGEKRQLPLRIILIMREEYIARLYDFERYLPKVFDNRLRVESMNTSNIRQVIRGSCEQFGIKLRRPVQTANRIISRLTDTRRGIQLSYLQIYLDKLFRVYREQHANGQVIFSPDLVDRVGSIGDILVEFMEEQQHIIQARMKSRFGISDPDVISKIMDQFATLEGTRRSLNRMDIRMLGYSDAAVAYCISELVDSRLLRVDEGSYELSHDKLAEKIAETRDIQSRDLMRIQGLIRPKLAMYQERKVLFSEEELFYIRPYLQHFSLQPGFSELYNRSEQERRKEKYRLQQLNKENEYHRRETEKKNRQIEIINRVLYSNIWRSDQDYHKALQFALEAWRMSSVDGRPSLEIKQALISAYYAADENNAINYEREIRVGSIIRYIKLAPDESLMFVATASHDALLYNLSGKLIQKIPYEHVSVATFSPDSQWLLLATTDGKLFRINREGSTVETHQLDLRAIRQLVFLPAGNHFLLGAKNFIGRYDLNGKLIKKFILPEVIKEHDDIKQIVLAPDASYFVAISVYGHDAFCFSLQDDHQWILKAHTDKITAVDIAHDGDHLATVSADKHLIIWSRGGEVQEDIVAHGQTVISVQFSSDDRKILTASKDNTAKFWTIYPLEAKVLKGHEDDIVKAMFTPRDDEILTISNDHTARLWYTDGSHRLLSGHQGRISDAHALQHHGELITASSDQTIKFWNAGSTRIVRLDGHGPPGISEATFSPDGRLIVTVGLDGQVLFWNLGGRQYGLALEHPQAVDKAFFDPGGELLYTLGRDKILRAWTLQGEMVWSIGDKRMMINKARLAADGRFLFTLDTTQQMHIWDRDRKKVRTFPTHQAKVYRFDRSSTRDLLLTASKDNTAALWNYQGQLTTRLEGHRSNVHSAYFNQDGTRIITASADRTARIWDLAGHCQIVLGDHPRSVSRAFFIPGSSRYLTQSMGYDIRLWDEQGRLLRVLDGHSGHVNHISFSADGQYILSAANDESIILWDSHGEIIKRFQQHHAQVNGAFFSPDGRHFVSVDAAGKAISWLSPEGIQNAVSL